MSNKNPHIFLLPQFSNKIGYGHLKRSLILYHLFRKYHPQILYVNNKYNPLKTKEHYRCFSSWQRLIKYLKTYSNTYIILDQRYYNKKHINELSNLSFLIFIDSQKIYTTVNNALYINLTTPLHYKKCSSHTYIYEGLEYLPLNKDIIRFQKKKPVREEQIFICFGNSDPHYLSMKIIIELHHIHYKGKICLNIGQHFNKNYSKNLKKYLKEHFSQFQIIQDKKSIIPFLFQSSHLITSYGLTALEGVLFNKKIALFNNSRYHTSLSKKDHRYTLLGTFPYTPSLLIKNRLEHFIKDIPESKSTRYHNNKTLQNIFKQVFKNTSLIEPVSICPVCENTKLKLIHNQYERQFYQCNKCKSLLLKKHQQESMRKRYTHSYFNEEYKEQYGKSYLEDEENITKLARQRLSIIKQILKRKHPHQTILDIGAAYGFFLKQAQKEYFKPFGIEIEKKAVSYMKKKLNIPAVKNNFLKQKFNEKYHVITLWYVLEHFPNPDNVIKKAKSLLLSRGLLCLSVPNGHGPFFQFNRKSYFKLHPDDHYFDYSLKGLKILFKKHGFSLLYKRYTGYHPERYINCPSLLSSFIKLFYPGDTMELYFMKNK